MQEFFQSHTEWIRGRGSTHGMRCKTNHMIWLVLFRHPSDRYYMVIIWLMMVNIYIYIYNIYIYIWLVVGFYPSEK